MIRTGGIIGIGKGGKGVTATGTPYPSASSFAEFQSLSEGKRTAWIRAVGTWLQTEKSNALSDGSLSLYTAAVPRFVTTRQTILLRPLAGAVADIGLELVTHAMFQLPGVGVAKGLRAHVGGSLEKLTTAEIPLLACQRGEEVVDGRLEAGQ